jgi:diacylglycerol kinase family enzyme
MNRISSSLDNPSNPLLEAMDRAKQAENDGIDMIQDDHKS